MLFDTKHHHHHRKSVSLNYPRNRSISNASIYDNVIFPTTNGYLS